MKNVLKKVTAAVMAFTVLGGGSVITKTVAPQSDTTLVASAGWSNPNCQFHGRDTYRVYFKGKINGKERIVGHYLYCSCCRGFIDCYYYYK